MWQYNKTIQKLNFDYFTKENLKEHNPNSPQIPDHPYRILRIGGSELIKTNTLLDLINHKIYSDKIYLYTEDPYETKYQFFIKECEGAGLKHFNDSRALIDYSNDINEIVFDDTIADMLSNKKFNSTVTDIIQQ